MSGCARGTQMKKSTTQRRAKRDRYTPVACNECKLRKVKCSGHSTCHRCTKHAVPCVYDRMLPAELDASITRSNKDNIQSKLSRMQASLDCLLENVAPNIATYPAAQHVQSIVLTPSSSAHSPRGNDDIPNTAMEDISALVNIDDMIHHLSDGGNNMQSIRYPALPRHGGNATNAQGSIQQPVLPLSRDEALEVIDGFREEVETIYPFINLGEVESLLDALFHSVEPQNRDDIQTTGWNDTVDSRNFDFLKLVIACGLATRGKKENELSRELMASVEEKSLRRMNRLDVDMKDLAIATMTSVYYYQNDEITLAWRLIGAAARMCLELGLHKLSPAPTNEIGVRQANWVSKMFWCIYVLDRRYSFMTNLPFTFRDEDIDPSLPLPDDSSPFLLPMVSYGRLGAKIIPALPKLKSVLGDLSNDTYAYLGGEIDRWTQSMSTETSFKSISVYSFAGIEHQTSNNNLATFCRIRGNQMRLSLYKHALHSSTSIARNQHFAQLAVHCATENIRMLRQLGSNPGTRSLHSSPRPCGPNASNSPPASHLGQNAPSPRNGDVQAPGPQVQRNFFLVSSLAVLYLAIRNAPQRYSGLCVHEYFAALNLLRGAAVAPTASRRLQETVKTLERATCSLVKAPMPMFQNEGSSAQAMQVGFQEWTFPHVDGVLVEREDGAGESQSLVDNEREGLLWEDIGMGGFGMGGFGSELNAGHGMWTFTDDMGWQSAPDSYFNEPGLSPNVLDFGSCWTQESVT